MAGVGKPIPAFFVYLEVRKIAFREVRKGTKNNILMDGYSISNHGERYPYVHRDYSHFTKKDSIVAEYERQRKLNWKATLNRYSKTAASQIFVSNQQGLALRKITKGEFNEELMQETINSIGKMISTANKETYNNFDEILQKARAIDHNLISSEFSGKDLEAYLKEVQAGLSLLNDPDAILLNAIIETNSSNVRALIQQITGLSNKYPEGTILNFNQSTVINIAKKLTNFLSGYESGIKINKKYLSDVTTKIFNTELGESLLANTVAEGYKDCLKTFETNRIGASKVSIEDETSNVKSKLVSKADVGSILHLEYNKNGLESYLRINGGFSGKWVGQGATGKNSSKVSLVSGTKFPFRDNISFFKGWARRAFLYTGLVDTNAKDIKENIDNYIISSRADVIIGGHNKEDNALFIVLNGQFINIYTLLKELSQGRITANVSYKGIGKAIGEQKRVQNKSDDKNAKPNWLTAWNRNRIISNAFTSGFTYSVSINYNHLEKLAIT